MKIIKCFKLRTIIAVSIAIIIVACMFIGIKKIKHTENSIVPYTIVLDAGHGGRDNGVTGVNGTVESEINLQIVKRLRTQFENLGFRVVLTRENESGLYSENVSNYKKDDMTKRKEIIEKSKADLIISIHQNSYPSSHSKGAQVFCLEKNTESEKFANAIQSQIIASLPNARSSISYGDYYLLKCSKMPSVIVECGYLTNVEEEVLLNSADYQEKVAYTIACGVLKYLGFNND